MLGLIIMGVSAALEVAGTAAQVAASNAATEAAEQSVKTQELTNEYKITKTKNQELNVATQELDENEMRALNKNVSLSSPSFNAIQRDTLTKAQEALHADMVFSKVNTLSTKSKLESLDEQNFISNVGAVANLGASIAGSAAQYGEMQKRDKAFMVKPETLKPNQIPSRYAPEYYNAERQKRMRFF